MFKMFGKLRNIIIAAAVSSVVLLTVCPSRADVTGRPHDLSLDNPRGHCINCHDLHQTGLGEGFAHNLKRANEVAVCYQCHAGALNDYSSIDPSYPNPSELESNYDIRSEFNQTHIHFERYGMDGENNHCSDCHNPHGVFNASSTTRLPKLLSAGPDKVTDTDEFCFVCHNSDQNPPHSPFPNISVGSQYRFSRTTYKQMTHSTFARATTLTEPVPDTARTYDDNPYGKGKDISCLTCHRPHGSPNDHMLRSPDDETFCLTCHDGTKAADLSEFDVTGHGKAGADRICQDCHFPHGTGQENAIKTGITDPHTGTEKPADVNGSGMNAACMACHSEAQTGVYSNAFPSNVSGWSSSGLTTTWDGTKGHSAPGSLKQVTTDATDRFSYTTYYTVKPNTRYVMSGYLYLPQALSGTGARLRVIEYNSSNGVTADKSSTNSTTTGGMWMYKSFTLTTEATTAKVILRLNLNSVGTAYWDEISLKETPYYGGYFTGFADYAASIHATSPNAHNPSDTAGDQQAGECDNCHDPHGRGNGKMLIEPAPAVCYDCHNASTPNTVSGDDVQAAFQMTSHHDLSKVGCANCHNVHKATQASVMMDPYNPAASLTDPDTFCLSCHSGSMPQGVTGAPNVAGEWTGGGHDATHSLNCTDCHEPHGSSNPSNLNYRPLTYGGYTAAFTTGLNFGQRAFCEVCHTRTASGYKGAKVIPTGAGYVSQHGSGDSTPCSNCHALKHNPRLSNYTGTASFYTLACLECHTQGAGNPYPDADAEFNTPANTTDADTRRSIHAVMYRPYSSIPTVDCVSCHGSNHEVDHSATNKVTDPDPSNGVSGAMPSVATSSVFCLECHDDTPVKIGGYTPPDIKSTYASSGHGMASAGLVCSQCHLHHGSYNQKLIRQTINGRPVSSNYSGNNTTVCTACHEGTDANLPKWPGFAVYSGSIHSFGNWTTGNLVTDGTHGPGVCVNCHNPHGSMVDGTETESMARKDQEDLCFSCHASGFDNFSTPGNYNDKWTRFGSVAPVAKEHGALHVGRSVVDANTDIMDGLESTATYPDRDAEISVKLKVTELTRTDGTAQFGIWIYDPRNTSSFVKLFYRGHSNPNNWVARFTGDGGAIAVIPIFGDESTTYHKLRLVRRTADNEVDAYVDNTLVYTCPMTMSGYFKVRLFYNLYGYDATPETMDLWFDEFNVDYLNDGTVHNTASRDDVQARFYMKSHHKISDIDQLGPDGLPGTDDDAKVECTDCHDPHTITEKLMAFRNVSGVVVPIEADQEFCLKCHDGDPPAGVQFPVEGVWDKSGYDFSAHGNPLMRNRTFGNYSNGVVYACKVCHNPHGSDQVALERETWDLDRDGIPDDIDGDGVLDSSTLVGFIGYSSGSRKVIVVDSPRPGFKRISTTIPYQENGSIDVELCLNCHDGTPAPDVETDFEKRSHHDVTYAEQQADGGSKIECYNCHDQHRAQARDDSRGEYPTTNPDPPREPMPGDAQFCLRCHDNTLPEGLSFGSKSLKNIKLSYNPNDHRDANGYDLITTFIGHYELSTGEALMCRDCHNQHGSDYDKMIRDDTEQAKPNHDPSQLIQEIQPLALRPSDTYGGGDDIPLSSTTERCLACHSGATRFKGHLLPLPPPPDSEERGFTMSPVGKHPDLKSSITFDNETGGHIFSAVFAVITTPGSIKDECTLCHDSHNPYINTVSGQLMDCYQCHNENTALPDVQSEFNDNPTNPTRSQSIHPIHYDPTGTDSTAVECLKCHDQSRHMQGTVRLRKDPSHFDNYTSDAEVWADPVATGTVNQFCLECHDPNTTVAASFWRDGVEHVPPRLPAGYASGAHFTDGSLLCTDCHEYHGSVNKGLRKNEYGDEETFCYGCHNNPANSMNGVNIQSKFGQANHHDVDATSQTAHSSKVECEDCHNPHVVTRSNPVVSQDDRTVAVVNNTAFCIGCHDSDGAPGVKFPGYSTGTNAAEWDTSTGAWNRWNKESFINSTTSAHMSGGISCISCHDPHGSPNYSMLLQNISGTTGITVGFGLHSTARGDRTEELGVNSLCSSCHSDAMGVYNGYASFTSLTFGGKMGIGKNCTYCHNPHGTAQPKLIRSDKPLNMDMASASFGSVYNFKGFGNHTTGAPYYTFCSSRNCHASERSQLDTFNMDLPVDNFTHDETKSSHHPIKEGVIGCTSCHMEHGSVNSPDLRAPFYRESNWPELYHSGIGVYDNYRRPGYNTVNNPYGPDIQFFGNDVNFFEQARSGQPDATYRNKVTTVNPPSNANDLCFMCHQKDDIIGTTSDGMTGTNTKFLGHEAVKGGATVSHNISKNTNGIGSDYHNFSCSFCHFPHSSSRGKLLKVGCFSQSDGGAPNTSYGTVFQCHAYRGWSNYNYGWRNITTTKTDFKRPPNAVSDLAYVLDADLTVNLSWTAVEDQQGQGAHHYNVYRSTQSITQATKPYATRLMQGVSGPAAGNQVNWSDLTGQPGVTYYYAVVACDAENNESFVSNCVTVSLGPDTVAPNAISNQQTRQVDGTYNVRIDWSDPGDNVNVTQYDIYRIDGLTPLTGTDIVPGNYKGTVTDSSLSSDGSPDSVGYTYTDTTAVFGQDYSYAVVAVDAASNVSAVPTGTSFSVTIVDPAPAPVTTLTARPVSLAMSTLLNWSAPTNVGNISGYNVYRKAGSALTQSDLVSGNLLAGPVTGLTYTDTLVPLTGTDYYYAVTAIDESSTKESSIGNSPTVNLTVPPSDLTAAMCMNSAVIVNWSAPAYTNNLQGYNVYKRRNSGAWTAAGTVSSTTRTATVSILGLEPGTYDFAVTAKYSTYQGTTPYESVMSSSVAVAITDTAAPEDFTVTGLLTAASNYTRAQVSWNAPADLNFTGYTPSGLDSYRIEATYDQGATWNTLLSTRLVNASFETHTGTVDDTTVDGFTSWYSNGLNVYAVSDSFIGSRAMKMSYAGSGDRYVRQIEPTTGQSIANKVYSLSFWAKANKSTTMEYYIQANGGNNEIVGDTTPSIGTSWQRFTTSGTFSGAVTATSANVIIRPPADTTVDITLDAVRLETGTNALLANDGSWYKPSGYDTPGSPQSYEDPVDITAGTSAMYRVQAVDVKGNISNAASTAYLYAKPTPITDLNVINAQGTSANVLNFSPSASLAGLSVYNIYAKEQSYPLSDLAGTTLIASLSPTTSAGNIALAATASASHTYSTYYASNANDGNTGTRWDGQANVGPNWLQLDFGTSKVLSKVSFNFYNSTSYMPKDYLIQTYNGSSWVTQYNVTGNTSSTPVYTFDPPVITSKVRIYITSTYNTTMSYRPIIYEFSAYASEQYVHDLQNTALKAEAGHTYAYAVIAEDVNGLVSDLSGGPNTYTTVLDNDPPAKVSDLTLATPVGTTQAILSWSTPIDNLGYGTGTGAQTYRIYRLPTSSIGTPEAVTDDNYATSSLVYTGTYASSTAGTFNNYTATWYDHKGVYYAVRSSDAAGNWSPVSNSPYIMVGKDIEAPTPPVITNCVPVTTPEVDVYWNPAVDNIGINGYRLFRAPVDQEPFLTDHCITENNVDMAEIAVNLIPYNAVETADMGGTAGQTYYYALRAWDDENNLSNISNCAVATVRTTATDSTPPVWTNATSLTVIQQPYPDIDLIWSQATDQDDSSGAGTIDHYDIFRSLTNFSATTDPGVSKIATVSGVRSSYIDNTGEHETTYYYGIVAVDASVNANASALSNVESVTVAVAPSPDNTPPTVPTGLSASTGVYPYINLSWTASTDVDDAAAPQQLLYYKLYRSDYPLDITDANKDNTDLVQTYIMANDAVSYVARGIGDMMYNYRLEAFDMAGNPSGLSDQVTAQVASAPCTDSDPPTAPTGLTAVNGPSPDIDLSWTASNDNTGSCNGVVDHYQLYKADYEITVSTDLRTLPHIHVAGNSTTFVDSTGEPNKQYWYVMTAVDSSGNESVISNIITRTTSADTMAPAAIADLKVVPNGSQALLTWCKPSDNVGIDHYEIYRKEQATILIDADITPANKIATFVNTGTCLSYNDAGVSSGHTYSYAVIAVDGAGNRSTISRGEQSGDTIVAMP